MKSKKLLIIDDDPDILASLEVILGAHGFIVYTASGKDQGVNQISANKPDLIILDNMMENDLEGYGMLNAFRDDESMKNIPIIMYSGMAEKLGVNFRSAVEDEKMFSNVSFVDKREDIKILIQKVEEALEV